MAPRLRGLCYGNVTFFHTLCSVFVSKKEQTPLSGEDVVLCPSIDFQTAYSHPSLLAGSQIRDIVQRIKINYLHPLTDRGTKIVRQLELVFEPHRIMFRELKGKQKTAPIKKLLQTQEKQ